MIIFTSKISFARWNYSEKENKFDNEEHAGMAWLSQRRMTSPISDFGPSSCLSASSNVNVIDEEVSGDWYPGYGDSFE